MVREVRVFVADDLRPWSDGPAIWCVAETAVEERRRYLRLRFALRNPRVQLDTGVLLSDRDIDVCDLRISRSRLAKAIKWLLDLDASARRQLSSGSVIEKEIPWNNPTAPRVFAENAIYARQLRRPAVELVRPLFLRAKLPPSLRRFQKHGVKWLCSRRTAALLADDMGLGKTVQALVAAKQLIAAGELRTVLVVCPRSLTANWTAELRRWTPELTYAHVIPHRHDRESTWSTLLNRVHVLLTNYEQLREPPGCLTSTGVDLLIADEAHRIRNMASAVSKGIGRIRRRLCWLLTGTPIERDATDLRSLLSILEPARFSSNSLTTAHSALRAMARPYILRRTKRDVLREVPDVLVVKETLDLLPEQQLSYRRALSTFRTGDRTTRELLALITLLRSICDLDPETRRGAKVERALELIEDIALHGENAVVFSYLLEPLRALGRELSRRGISHSILDGTVPPETRTHVVSEFQSGNLTALLLSTRVGGEGLTLTAANHVIFLNEWWNPSTNDQARDRLVRIGQKKAVVDHRFRCKNTIEERLEEILRNKRRVFSRVLDQLDRSMFMPTAPPSDPEALDLLWSLIEEETS